MARWQPDSGHPQVDLGDAATFTPSKEEFADPFAYIASIAEQFVKQGIAKIVPPPGCWASPAYVQQLKAACSSGGSDCSVAEGLVFNAQRQFLSHLCMRAAAAVGNGTVATAAGAGPSRYAKFMLRQYGSQPSTFTHCAQAWNSPKSVLVSSFHLWLVVSCACRPLCVG